MAKKNKKNNTIAVTWEDAAGEEYELELHGPVYAKLREVLTAGEFEELTSDLNQLAAAIFEEIGEEEVIDAAYERGVEDGYSEGYDAAVEDLNRNDDEVEDDEVEDDEVEDDEDDEDEDDEDDEDEDDEDEDDEDEDDEDTPEGGSVQLVEDESDDVIDAEFEDKPAPKPTPAKESA